MIIPAILEKDWASIEKKIKACEQFANPIHIDFIDGKFHPNTTFLEIEKFKQYSDYFKLEAHLMVEEPINYLDRLYEANFRRVLGHVEKMSDQVEFVAKGQGLFEIGLALDLNSSVDLIKVPFDDLDQVLLMAVNAGQSGQGFDEKVLEKIQQVIAKNYHEIEIDGGINDQTLPKALNAGANSFCATSFIFNGQNPEEQFRKLEAFFRD